MQQDVPGVLDVPASPVSWKTLVPEMTVWQQKSVWKRILQDVLPLPVPLSYLPLQEFLFSLRTYRKISS